MHGPAPAVVTNTNYASTISVADADPRIISNLIVDQTATNPSPRPSPMAAPQPVVQPAAWTACSAPPTTGERVLHPERDAGRGPVGGFNTWFTFFGQFFDHGLDLVDKGGNGTVFIPLQPDDPLFTDGSAPAIARPTSWC